MKKIYICVLAVLFAILTLVGALCLILNIVSGLNDPNGMGIIGGADTPTVFLILKDSLLIVIQTVLSLALTVVFTIWAVKKKN